MVSYPVPIIGTEFENLGMAGEGHRRSTVRSPWGEPGITAPERRLSGELFPYESRLVDAGRVPGALHRRGRGSGALPALVAWGGRDFAFRDAERRRFEAAFPRHRTVVFERAGHYIQQDVPGELASAIERWWGEDGP